jgi:glycosyltransferase A (GT-A) superfamily protein (DUF2064 family)
LSTVAVAIVCKTPAPGLSKTRLSPPLRPEECAAISGCFIRDLAQTIGALARHGDVTGYALYTPRGSEASLRRLLPDCFEIAPQHEGGFGARLFHGIADLLNAGHTGAILVNSDSPTLPERILRDAVDAVRGRNCVVLSPAFDGGYTLIGLSKCHTWLFEYIPWSLPVVNVPGWYDVDDEQSLHMLEQELSEQLASFANGAEAPATRRFLSQRKTVLTEPAA